MIKTFPIVRRNDEKTHGPHRIKDLILELYNAMAKTERTGNGRQMRRDPRPGVPRTSNPVPEPRRKVGVRG